MSQPQLETNGVAMENDAAIPSSPSKSHNNSERRRDARHKIGLVVFASVSTFFYAGAIYGWGPMQLLLEANGNFASRCPDDFYDDSAAVVAASNATTTTPVVVCPEQTAAFLNCRFVSLLTLLTGTVWGILSDRFGTRRVLMTGFGLCNIVGIALLMIGVTFPQAPPALESLVLYVAFVLLGLGSVVGGMLTVETGLLFRNDPKQQNRVISLTNALFDAGAMAYLGFWGIQQLVVKHAAAPGGGVTQASAQTSLLWILGGYLFLGVVCIGGYAYFFQSIESIASANRHPSKSPDGTTPAAVVDEASSSTSGGTPSITLPLAEDNVEISLESEANIAVVSSGPSTLPGDTSAPMASVTLPVEDTATARDGDLEAAAHGSVIPEDHNNNNNNTKPPLAPPSNPYTPIAQRPPTAQLRSKAYLLFAVWFAFHNISSYWTLTTARDFLGSLGDDAFGNRYLGIFTLLTPVSLVALPFLDATVNKLGFHAALQAVNLLGIAHGLVRVCSSSLNAQIVGFVLYTFFRCFLYAVGFSCVASFVGPSAMGRATGTLYLVAGLSSLANLGLADLAVSVGDFRIPNLVFLVGTLPLMGLTWVIGRALAVDREATIRSHNETKG